MLDTRWGGNNPKSKEETSRIAATRIRGHMLQSLINVGGKDTGTRGQVRIDFQWLGHIFDSF